MKFKNKLLGLTLGLALTIGVGYSLANNQGQAKMASAETNYVLLTTENFSELTTDTPVVIADVDLSQGVTGAASNNKDATVSANKSTWLNFKVTELDATKMTYSLQNGATGKWITKPSSNIFAINSSTKTDCAANADGYFKINNRFLCQNGTYYRCYNSIGSYKPFYVYMAKDVTGQPLVKITSNFANLEKGSKGTVEYETVNATNPIVTFSSEDETIVKINSSTGEFEVLKGGSTKIIVSMTCDESSTPIVAKKVITANFGLITIEEALELIKPLGNKETSTSTLSIRGYIVSLNGDNQKAGSERMLVLSDKKFGEEGGKTINVYGVYSSAAERKYMIINGEITVTGKPTKYNGNGQITGPSLSDYNDAAIDFAKEANTLLDPECAATDVKEETWNTIKAKYEALDSYAQAKLKAATSGYKYSDDIANFVARYTIIVRGYKYNDFMGTVNASRLTSVLNNNSSLTILSVMSIAALIGACLLIVKLKKSKHE